MSDNWITLIPEDPFYVPDPSRRNDACTRFAEIASEFDSIKVILSDKVVFFTVAVILDGFTVLAVLMKSHSNGGTRSWVKMLMVVALN